jgi:micrococcal nuclease
MLVLLILLVCSRIGCFGPVHRDDRSRYHQRTFTVVKVVDGDTLDIAVTDLRNQKSNTRIRLWGVDTPETKHPGKPVQHYGPEASAFTTRQTLNQAVTVVLEPFENTRGKYGRLLAYIYLSDGKMLNEELIAQGYGYADPRFDHVMKMRFRKLQKQARKYERGLWKAVPPDELPKYLRD